MFDLPHAHKIHQHFTPSLGGIAIIIGAIISILIAIPFAELSNWKFFLIALALMFITGLRDDTLTLSPRQKLFSQLLPIILLVVFGKVQLTSFYDIHATPFSQWLSWIISVFTITILTNAYNLIDGIDGFAGSIAAIVFLFFGIWFSLTGYDTLAIIAFAFLGGTLAFLFFNWQPAQIFMGDTGSLTLGFLISFLTLQFINANYTLGHHAYHFTASIATAICVVIIPVFDTLRVIIIRLSQFQSPFKADQNHLHHQLLAIGLSHAQSVLVLVSFNLLIIGIAYILRSQSDTLILPVVAVICVVAHFILRALRNQMHERQSTIS